MLQPGATIGILGGGQLGRMLAMAAAQLGLKSHIFAPEPDSPAFDVAAARTCAAYDDEAALKIFARAVDVVTYEFENVPVAAVDLLVPLVSVRPGRAALEAAQDRLIEKRFLNDLGIPTARFLPVESLDEAEAAGVRLGFPFLLKTRRLGYDGKGQARVSEAGDIAAAYAVMGGQPAIAEAFVPFTRESSIIAVRGAEGAFAAYEPGQNVHEDGILRRTIVDGRIASGAAEAMSGHVRRLCAALEYVGVLGVEFFLVETGQGVEVIANEFAPRVHNSGHWTMDGAATSQFEQHIRAIAGWPLGAADRLTAIEMVNLIGSDVNDWTMLVAEQGAALHLYGKKEARPGRKMGHVNRRLRG